MLISNQHAVKQPPPATSALYSRGRALERRLGAPGSHSQGTASWHTVFIHIQTHTQRNREREREREREKERENTQIHTTVESILRLPCSFIPTFNDKL